MPVWRQPASRPWPPCAPTSATEWQGKPPRHPLLPSGDLARVGTGRLASRPSPPQPPIRPGRRVTGRQGGRAAPCACAPAAWQPPPPPPAGQCCFTRGCTKDDAAGKPCRRQRGRCQGRRKRRGGRGAAGAAECVSTTCTSAWNARAACPRGGRSHMQVDCKRLEPRRRHGPGGRHGVRSEFYGIRPGAPGTAPGAGPGQPPPQPPPPQRRQGVRLQQALAPAPRPRRLPDGDRRPPSNRPVGLPSRGHSPKIKGLNV